MQLLRVVFILAAVAAVTGQYLQERYRLTRLQTLPGREARDRYEARRRSSERAMTWVTAVLAAAGVAALVDLIIGGVRQP
jgi:hypothetical protein